MRLSKKLKVGVLLLLLMIFLTSIGIERAHAVPMLELWDGVTTVSVSDGAGGDVNSALGAITFIGPIGSFFLNVTTGLTKPVIGSADYPEVDIMSVNVSGGSGTLTIKFTDTDFTGLGMAGFLSEIGGTTDGSVTFNSYLDTGNISFGTATTISTLGPYSGGAFSGSSWTSLTPSSAPYSITLVTTVVHNSGNKTSSFDARVAVPEPSSLILLGSGLLSIMILGRIGRKRINKKGR